ncbi:alanine/ornithine racemase family PLP-dependent enzyme [Marinilabiliaceae bacterium JC017]|nr:alanine/ornithine racemase family PLP-dependent enzyme [Marinilabiliaceae bacterium JC017]
MAYITLNSQKLKENYLYLDELFQNNNINWAVVSKMLCGNKTFLNELLKLGIKQVCDSRVSNLVMIKSLQEDIETIYIKPPPRRAIKQIVKYADISINTEGETIRLLSEEARKQNKTHKIIIMIELGELREGVMREDFIDFYEEVFQLPNIKVVGIGTNFTCLYGVLPSHDKLIQLSLYEQLVEAKFNREIPFVSGGSSVTIPLIFQNLLPGGINHFRVGESLFLGTDVYNNDTLEHMHNDVFRLYAEIIELIEKPKVPMGEMGTNVEGESYEFEDEDLGSTSYRAILDLGLLDVEESHLLPVDAELQFAGASSDMLVMDLGTNPDNYKIGDLLEFKMDYMGTLRAISSRYIEKKVVAQ